MDQNQATQATEATEATEGQTFIKKPVAFHFRKDDKTGIKRDSIELHVDVPTAEGLAEVFNEGGRGLQKVLMLMEDAICEHIRKVLSTNKTLTAATFPMDQATWQAFVDVPDAEAAARGIPKALWDEFKKDYIAVMPTLIGKSVEAVTTAAKILIDNRFSNVKTDKPVVSKLQEYLAIYATKAPNAASFAACITALDDKATALLAAESSDLLDNI